MKRLVKIVVKIIAVVMVLLFVLFGILYSIYNEPIPVGRQGPTADRLAQKMLDAINYDTYQETRFIEWSFVAGAHHYKWDKANGKVQVAWDNYLVKLNLNKLDKSQVFENDSPVEGTSRTKLISKATDYFNNDSFWLVAPFKVFDKGTDRRVVTLEDGSKGLLVLYSSGGTTPGDAYLWRLLPNGFPRSFKMWVQRIPIGGLEATWDDWKVMENGLALPASHQIGPMSLNLEALRAYN